MGQSVGFVQVLSRQNPVYSLRIVLHSDMVSSNSGQSSELQMLQNDVIMSKVGILSCIQNEKFVENVKYRLCCKEEQYNVHHHTSLKDNIDLDDCKA